ncbi:MAG: hypothetical protein QOF27_1176 [Gaiellaceae bacterium]|nr:hypothetical protein [Gaiellaceae bacterium]
MPRARSTQAGDEPKPKSARTTRARAPAPDRASAAGSGPEATPKASEPSTPPGDGGARVAIDASMVKGLARSASRIVSRASTILEEELAAGIGAAKQIESRFLNVSEMRSTNTDEVMARFRKDAHEVVDIVLDLLNVPTRSLGGLGARASVGEESAGRTVGTGADSPTIRLPDVVPAGTSAAVPFSLENDGETPTAEFEFQATDLVNAGGDAILGQHVRFEPAKLTIAPHDRESVTISVEVPVGTAPGVYSGLVLASKLERLRAVLVVSVP